MNTASFTTSGTCATPTWIAEDKAMSQNKTAPQDTTKTFSPSVQSQGHQAFFEDVFKAFSDNYNRQLDELGRALKAQMKTQSDQISQLLQALTIKVAEDSLPIDQLVARVDQLGNRIDRQKREWRR